MNLQKENKSSNNQDIKQILVEILNEYKVDSMKYLKKKNIFKGDFLLWLKHSKIILIFFQTNKENSLHIIDLNEEMVLKSAKINLNFVKKDSKLDFEVKKIVVSSDEKLISFVGKRHIAIEEISKIKTRKSK